MSSGSVRGFISRERLFVGQLIRHVAVSCLEKAGRAVDSLSEQELAAKSIDDLTEDIVYSHVPLQIDLRVADHWQDLQPMLVAAQQGRAYAGMYMPSARQAAAERLEATLHIPYSGSRQAFKFRPASRQGVEVEAAVTDSEVVLSVVGAEHDAGQLERELLQQERQLVDWVEAVNSGVAAIAQEVRSDVGGRLHQQHAIRARRDEIAAAMTIPARPVQSGAELEIPARRRRVRLTADAAAPKQAAQWQLADPLYEQLIDTVIRFGHALERRPASTTHPGRRNAPRLAAFRPRRLCVASATRGGGCAHLADSRGPLGIREVRWTADGAATPWAGRAFPWALAQAQRSAAAGTVGRARAAGRSVPPSRPVRRCRTRLCAWQLRTAGPAG